jgi:hypothetical protein
VMDEPAFPVAEALFAEAGEIDLADTVMASLGIGAVPLAEAVRAEAGEARVADAVMMALSPMPASLPEPANDPAFRSVRGWGLGLVALAAVALIALFVGQSSGPIAVPESHPLLFAQAGDVVVEDLSYGAGVQVFQIEGEQGAVILWVDEGA